MTTLDWNTLMQQAAAEGYSNETLPANKYEVEVVGVKIGASKNGKPSLGIRLKVLAGPHTNATLWDNLYVSPESPKAMAIFFRKCNSYGAGQEFFTRGASLEEIGQAMVGSVGIADVAVKTGAYDGNEVKSFKASSQVGYTLPQQQNVPSFPPIAGPGAPGFPVAPSFPVRAGTSF